MKSKYKPRPLVLPRRARMSFTEAARYFLESGFRHGVVSGEIGCPADEGQPYAEAHGAWIGDAVAEADCAVRITEYDDEEPLCERVHDLRALGNDVARAALEHPQFSVPDVADEPYCYRCEFNWESQQAVLSVLARGVSQARSLRQVVDVAHVVDLPVPGAQSPRSAVAQLRDWGVEQIAFGLSGYGDSGHLDFVLPKPTLPQLGVPCTNKELSDAVFTLARSASETLFPELGMSWHDAAGGMLHIAADLSKGGVLSLAIETFEQVLHPVGVYATDVGLAMAPLPPLAPVAVTYNEVPGVAPTL